MPALIFRLSRKPREINSQAPGQGFWLDIQFTTIVMLLADFSRVQQLYQDGAAPT
jgi:hypothetical protein